MEEEKDNGSTRQRAIDRVTLRGSMVNALLLVFKFLAGILGGSAAMIADAVHSLTDFVTDIIVFVFVKVGNKPADHDHGYGHGKYETLATAIIGMALLIVSLGIAWNGCTKTCHAMMGQPLPQPGFIALAAAVLSIVLKEWAYRVTVRVGREEQSQAVVANAWHHRSDALSSIGTFLGVGGAIVLGHRWAVLDPLSAIIVSIFIFIASLRLVRPAMSDLMEHSLPDNVEAEIRHIVESEPQTSELHHLRTRRIGNAYAMEMHLRMPGDMSLYEAHAHATHIENRLRAHFGPHTYISIHLEPIKIHGSYVAPQSPVKTKEAAAPDAEV